MKLSEKSEKVAGDDERNQGSKAVALLTQSAGDGFQFGMVGKGHRATEGVAGQLVDEGLGELILTIEQEEALESCNSAEFLFVEEGGVRVDGLARDGLTPPS